MIHHKIAVIGGTGKSGVYVVRHLLEKGYVLKLLLRQPNRLTIHHEQVEVLVGDARDYQSVYTLVAGCEAVISTLGQPKGERSIFSDATTNVIKAMEACGISRYLVTTGLSVDVPGDQKSDSVKAATAWMYAHYPETTTDKQREYELLEESKLDWTMVRLPLIQQTNQQHSTEANPINCAGDSIGAADLASFLVSALEEHRFIRASPFLYDRQVP
ncbi:NAD(P)-dependent oxidoreductase [Parapedobacter koreensis]|uniref:Putative NADH-flavin reductase n=1 Tax=Parapedobacter koreensis TaxID=332977 RepID=A0A1H7T396_9SPHI|nr:NAD(P)H-binding protein [Parapedobacter koreensis]SEL78724.1 Putative NADH-flavin reductase [Parapedobacter koreensis]